MRYEDEMRDEDEMLKNEMLNKGLSEFKYNK